MARGAAGGTVDVLVAGAAGDAMALAVGVRGGDQEPLREIHYGSKYKCFTAKITVPPDAGALDLYVYRKIGDHWVQLGAARADVNALGPEFAALAAVRLADDGAPPPAMRARCRGARRHAARAPGAPDAADEACMAEYEKIGQKEITDAITDIVWPPLLCRTLDGRVPLGATFPRRVAGDAAVLRGLLALACVLDAERPAWNALRSCAPAAAARVLARLALVANTMRYVVDEAVSAAPRRTSYATPDAAPDAAPGTVLTNLYTPGDLVWAEDCEGMTATTAGLWAALRAADLDETRELVAAYRFVVVVCAVERSAAFHVCAALLPRVPNRPAALVESVVRTAALPAHAAAPYARPEGADRRRERPLVRTGATLNDWYGRVVFCIDPDAPFDLLIPWRDARPGGSVADLLDGAVTLVAAAAALPPAAAAAVLARRAAEPAFPLARLHVGAGEPRGGPMAAADAPPPASGAFIAVRAPEPGVPWRTFAF